MQVKSLLFIALAALMGTSCRAVSEEPARADAGEPRVNARHAIHWPIAEGVSSFVTQSAARSGEPFPCGSGVNAQHILDDDDGENHDYEHSLDIVARNRTSETASIPFEGRGTDIVAVADGVVVAVSHSQSECERTLGAGNYIIVEHPQLRVDGRPILSAYMHLNSSEDVELAQECELNPAPSSRDGFAKPQVGSEVRAGQKIGELGNTGNSTGAHLHFQFATDCLLAPASDVACTAISILDIDPRGFADVQIARDASCPTPLGTGGPQSFTPRAASYLSDGSYITALPTTSISHLAVR
tara:strand:+ start:46885 stop:47781 length:897 start_codon:yes stop_codon:yes gene_type:complete